MSQTKITPPSKIKHLLQNLEIVDKSQYYQVSVKLLLQYNEVEEFLEAVTLFWYYCKKNLNASALSFFGHDLRMGFCKARDFLSDMLNVGVYNLEAKTFNFDALPKPWKNILQP